MEFKTTRLEREEENRKGARDARVRGRMPIFIEAVVRLLLKTGRKKEGKRREIIERPRTAIDANKAAEPRAHKLSEEMRRLISLLDLDSFLRPRESLSLSLFRLPLSSPI